MRHPNVFEYALGVIAVACAIALASLLRDHVVEPDLVMIFLLGVALVAFWVRLGPAVFTAILAVAAYNFFFVAPEYTFEVADARYLITFAVMAGVGVVLSSLTARLHLQTIRAREREARTTALYRLTHELVGTSDAKTLADAAASSIQDAFGCDVSVFLIDHHDNLRPVVDFGEPATAALARTTRSPSVHEFPLVGAQSQIGKIVVRARKPLQGRDLRQLLATFVGQVALALERTRMEAARKQAVMEAEAERLRNTLLSSVSHDLRTPLGSIMGSATTLLDRDAHIESVVRHELLTSIYDEADRLSRLLNNLLAMTRIEGGNGKLNTDWQVPEEAIGAALRRLEHRTGKRSIQVEIAAEIELVRFDGLLLELVLSNLIENAIKYTNEDTPIELGAFHVPGHIQFEVRDRGPGVPPSERAQLFTKFYRGKGAAKLAGTGLGLAICKAVVEAHGGRIWVSGRDDGPGSVFAFTIPASSTPPMAPEFFEDLEPVSNG